MLVALCPVELLLAPYRARRQSAAYLGFDRNDYPGDANLAALRKTFAFTGYWLSNPPGESSNSWHGKREPLQRAGFGFLLLFNGRDYAELKSAPESGSHPTAQARRCSAATAEGFPRGSVIFLDQEQGGRMLPEQKQYVFAWADAVAAPASAPESIAPALRSPNQAEASSARRSDLHDSPQGQRARLLGRQRRLSALARLRLSQPAPPPEASGAPFAEVWQFAQSPLRRSSPPPARTATTPTATAIRPAWTQA